MKKTLRLILGDQLNASHSWLENTDQDILYVLMEMRQETDYVRHHIQKVVAFFSAMRNFHESLLKAGHEVIYLRINDPQNRQSIAGNLEWILEEYPIQKFEYQLPDEYRLDQLLAEICQGLPIPFSVIDTEHFLTNRQELTSFFKGKKTYVMENFYRMMRKKYHILLDEENKPIGGKWNYDAENRNRYDTKQPVPATDQVVKSVMGIVKELREAGIETIGNIDASNFLWPTSRKEAVRMLEDFIVNRLPWFGTYQDSLDNEHWALFHSRISFPLNAKILHPLEVVEAAISHWQDHQDTITLSQIEGFVRQIIGWREFMRGIYWGHMPDYALKNYFNHDRQLPSWFWTGDTNMKCLSTAIHNSLDNAYAHHIQRLMVTGNFALLAGISPDELDAWYLGIYIDAIEWVEITNTRGMSQFADGGLVGTKPYVSSANYIHKMSNHCSSCKYDRKKRHGEMACPFNSLYWHFYDRNEELLQKNPRIGFAYRNLAKMKNEERVATLMQAEKYLDEIELL